jgi:hypothetical protein
MTDKPIDRILHDLQGRGVTACPSNADGRWLLAQRVAELHSAELTASATPGSPAFTFRFPSGDPPALTATT